MDERVHECSAKRLLRRRFRCGSPGRRTSGRNRRLPDRIALRSGRHQPYVLPTRIPRSTAVSESWSHRPPLRGGRDPHTSFSTFENRSEGQQAAIRGALNSPGPRAGLGSDWHQIGPCAGLVGEFYDGPRTVRSCGCHETRLSSLERSSDGTSRTRRGPELGDPSGAPLACGPPLTTSSTGVLDDSRSVATPTAIVVTR